jgi:secreted trypsin-like serine protease
VVIWTLALSVATAQAPPPIVNGEETQDFPQVGMLYYEAGNRSGLCSATVIHPQWLLTAAHCVDAMDGTGTTYFLMGTDWDQGLERVITVTEMHLHPDYSGTGKHDIGVMKLLNTVTNMDPMSVNDDVINSGWLGDEITYVGWGNSNNSGGGSGTKRTVTVNLDGVDSWNIYTFDDSGNQGNVCSGDSGGAALVPLGKDRWEMVGVNAFIYVRVGGQAECDHPEGAAGATRVDMYLDWIGEYVEYTVGVPGDAVTEPEVIDTGWWDQELPERPQAEETISGGCSATQTTALAAWLLPLTVLVRRRRG